MRFKWSGLASLVVATLQICHVVLISRFLAPAEIGSAATAIAIAALGAIVVDLGIGSAVSSGHLRTPDEERQFLSLCVITGTIFSVAMYLMSSIIAHALFRTTTEECLAIAAAIPVAQAIFGAQRSLFLRQQRFRRIALADIGGAATGTVLGIWLAAQGYGAKSLILGQVAWFIAGAVLSAMVDPLRRQRSVVWPRLFGELVGKFGKYQIGERLLAFGAARLDVLIVGAIAGAVDAGTYYVATNLAGAIVGKINPVFTDVALPALGEVKHEPMRMKETYLQVLSVVSYVTLPVLAGFAAVSDLLFSSAFGAKWSGAGNLVPWLCLVAAMRSLVNPIGVVLLASRRADLGFRWNCWVTAVHLSVVAIMSGVGGVEAVVMTLVPLQFLILVAAARLLAPQVISVSARDLTRTVAAPVFACAVMFVVVVGLRPSYGAHSPTLLLVLSVVVGAATYATMCFIFGRTQISRVWQAIVK